MTKVCPGCKRELPTAAFSVCKRAKDGLQTRCKECLARWYKENREARLAYQREYLSNPEVKARQKKYMAVYQNEYRAKKKAEAAK